MCRSALSLNSLHAIQPTAAASQCPCCAARNPAGSIAPDPMQCIATSGQVPVGSTATASPARSAGAPTNGPTQKCSMCRSASGLW